MERRSSPIHVLLFSQPSSKHSAADTLFGDSLWKQGHRLLESFPSAPPHRWSDPADLPEVSPSLCYQIVHLPWLSEQSLLLCSSKELVTDSGPQSFLSARRKSWNSWIRIPGGCKKQSMPYPGQQDACRCWAQRCWAHCSPGFTWGTLSISSAWWCCGATGHRGAVFPSSRHHFSLTRGIQHREAGAEGWSRPMSLPGCAEGLQPTPPAAPVQARRKSLSSWRKGVVSERLAIWSKHQSDPEPHFPRHPTRLAMTSETPNMSSLTSSPMHKTSSTQGWAPQLGSWSDSPSTWDLLVLLTV